MLHATIVYMEPSGTEAVWPKVVVLFILSLSILVYGIRFGGGVGGQWLAVE